MDSFQEKPSHLTFRVNVQLSDAQKWTVRGDLNAPFLQLLDLHVSLTDQLRDANEVVVLQIKESIWGRWVDQLVVNVGKVFIPAGLFGASMLQGCLKRVKAAGCHHKTIDSEVCLVSLLFGL